MLRATANLTHRSLKPQTMLVVEDEETCRRAFQRLLKRNGYVASAVGSAEEAWDLLQASGSDKPTWIFVDVDLPGISGLDLVRKLKTSNPSIHAVMVTGADRAMVQEFCQRNAVDYFPKPVDVPRLLQHLGGQMH
jgi:DNA-binding NtrC family response regulator